MKEMRHQAKHAFPKKRHFSWKVVSIILILISLITLIKPVHKDIKNSFYFLEGKVDYLLAKPSQKLTVDLQNQLPDLPNGCEVTSLSMLLNYYDLNTTKDQLASEIKHVDSFYPGNKRGNPHVGFVGYMSQKNGGWCVYNEPLYNLARAYTPNAVNFTGHDFNSVIKKVSDGHPVLIIVSTTLKPVDDMRTWNTPQGKVQVTPSSHCVVVTGYDKKQGIVYLNNPFGYQNQATNWQDLEAVYNQQGKQAIYIK